MDAAIAPLMERPPKPRGSSRAFVCAMPLMVDAAQARVFDHRLDALRCIYNAVLGKLLARLRHVRHTKAWSAARALPKGAARTEAFTSLRKKGGLTQLAAEQYARKVRDGCWFANAVGSHDTQTTATRACQAVEMFMFGKRGKPRFKARGRFRSISGKARAVLLAQWVETPRPRASFVGPMPLSPAVSYRGLTMRCVWDTRDAYKMEAMRARTLYVRLIKKERKGRPVWEAQFVQEGVAPRRTPVGSGRVSLDLGPSVIAAIGWDGDTVIAAWLERFCPTVKKPAAARRRLQRALDRSRRATNPQAFRADGTFKPGSRLVRSKAYVALLSKLREEERRLAAERKRAHGALANRLLAVGPVVATEKLSYKAFQKTFGASVARSAPGMFMSILSRKAASAGGRVDLIPTRQTRLSQACHKTQTYVKKPLSQRVHRFADGTAVDRDLYSAFLAGCVEMDGHGARLSLTRAHDAWASAEPRLDWAWRRHKQSVSGGAVGGSIGGNSGAFARPRRQNASSKMG